jgi:hypothetical protein
MLRRATINKIEKMTLNMLVGLFSQISGLSIRPN